MNRKTIAFTEIPAWTLPAKGDALALFEVVALAGLEEQWIRLSADDQRAIMGGNVFGKQEFCVSADGTLEVVRSVGFGHDCDSAEYGIPSLRGALAQRKHLTPGLDGPNSYRASAH